MALRVGSFVHHHHETKTSAIALCNAPHGAIKELTRLRLSNRFRSAYGAYSDSIHRH
jgi:hypothetical protein